MKWSKIVHNINYWINPIYAFLYDNPKVVRAIADEFPFLVKFINWLNKKIEHL